MSFMNANSLDELARRLAESVPESVKAFGRDLEGNFKAVLQAQLAKLDLVTRQDFDVQSAILQRTQAKLTELEARVKDLEAKLAEAKLAPN
jgi:BMFP domain-containing protein YqiC